MLALKSMNANWYSFLLWYALVMLSPTLRIPPTPTPTSFCLFVGLCSPELCSSLTWSLICSLESPSPPPTPPVSTMNHIQTASILHFLGSVCHVIFLHHIPFLKIPSGITDLHLALVSKSEETGILVPILPVCRYLGEWVLLWKCKLHSAVYDENNDD